MLTGKMVRVRITRDRVLARYLDTDSADWLDVAEQLLELFRGQEGQSRGEIEADIEEAFGADPSQLVHQGLAKLLEAHRHDRVLIFTYDNATVYQIARRFLVPAITHQTKVKERRQIL